MKKVLFVLLMCVFVASIGFANGSKESPSASAPVELEVSTNSTEENQVAFAESMYKELINEYNQANGTNYVLKFSPGQGMDITNTRMSSNDKPDIFQIDSPADVQRYAKDNLLLDLTPAAEKYGWKNTMFDWAYNLSKVNGRVMTLPMGYEGIVLWYDKTVAKEVGVDPEAITNKDQFEDALKKAQGKGYIPIMLGSQDWPWAQEWYLSIMYSYTGRDLLKSTLEGKSSWTDPRFKETVDLYKSWNEKGYLANGKSYILTSDDAINAFTTHKCLFKLEGTWATYWINPLTPEEQDNIGVMLHPAINNNEKAHLPIAVGGMYCASADAADKADVIGYILNGIMSQKYQGKFLELGMDVAPISVDKSQFENLGTTTKQMWNMVNNALADGAYGYTTYAFYPPETRVYCYEGIVDVMEGKITSAEYLQKMQDLNKKELANGFTPVLP